MKFKLFIVPAAMVLLTGCSAVQHPSQLNRLQIKVSKMEAQVDERDREIENLKYEIDTLASQINARTYSNTQTNYEPRYEETSRVDTSTTTFRDSYESESISGSTDDEIIRVSATARDVQKALKAAGFYTGPIDGKIGAKSKDAISSFQRDHDLVSDGIVGKRTWTALRGYLN